MGVVSALGDLVCGWKVKKRGKTDITNQTTKPAHMTYGDSQVATKAK